MLVVVQQFLKDVKDGKFDGYVGSGRNVTKQIEEQHELKEAKRAAESAELAKS